MIDVLQPFLIEEQKDADKYRNQVIHDFWICSLSREVSLLGRKEVLTGKAKFGILGDGKEVPQVAMARAFRKGDWRSGYYRDQTFMMALGLCTVEDFFAQLYAHASADPFSGGRQMNAHFSTATIDERGDWRTVTDEYNVSSDLSCTGGQMARGFGIAFASRLYRLRGVEDHDGFSHGGDEVSFVTIGDASTSEGIFWEVMNAAVVEQVPMAVSVWDDGYGISVPKEFQTAKGSISRALSGMAYDAEDEAGLDIYVAKAYDYAGLVDMYVRGIQRVRDRHVPALFHIEECTQPQGHSTSGSHQRYKSKDRLAWEEDADCIAHMAKWIVENGLSSEDEIAELRKAAKKYAAAGKNRAWKAFQAEALVQRDAVLALVNGAHSVATEQRDAWISDLTKSEIVEVNEVVAVARQLYHHLSLSRQADAGKVEAWLQDRYAQAHQEYHTHLICEGDATHSVPPVYTSEATVPAHKLINTFFDQKFSTDPRIIAFGEDVGHIGDVNQGFAGLQETYGVPRVFDTGIREWSIMGQAIGTAMRGLRPIAEIQYLDYLIYGLQPLTDDLATIRYRSDGQQAAPAIIRTRGHRLEGIWHAGSPMGMMIHSLRGMHVCVPRNMTQAAGMYNTLLAGMDPAIVVEPLNGYRVHERIPDNLAEIKLELGVPEVLIAGSDLTLVTYGSCVRVAQSAVERLDAYGVSVELIDVQTLLPFDLHGVIVDSLKKTSRILFLDEDVPGGASGYMMQQVLDEQGGYYWLDEKPASLTAHAHRPPYGSVGDYFTKPNVEDVFAAVMGIMHQSMPDVHAHFVMHR